MALGICAHLGDILASDEDGACIRSVKSCAEVEESTFTRARGADNCYEFALVYLHIDSVYRVNNVIVLLILLDKVYGFKHNSVGVNCIGVNTAVGFLFIIAHFTISDRILGKDVGAFSVKLFLLSLELIFI